MKIKIHDQRLNKEVLVELPSNALILQMKDCGKNWESVSFVMDNDMCHRKSIEATMTTMAFLGLGYEFRIIEAEQLTNEIINEN